MFWVSFGFGVLVGVLGCWFFMQEQMESMKRRIYHLQIRIEQTNLPESSDAKLVKNVKIGR